MGNVAQSCATVCTNHGGYNAATMTYAGSSGTNENCKTVSSTLSPGSAWNSEVYSGLSCGCISQAGAIYRDTSPTTAEGADTVNGAMRFCACNNP